MEGEPSLVERLARHLTAGRPEEWHERITDAVSLLAILKQPDPAMREAGDEQVWRAMINAALQERWNVPEALHAVPQDIAPGGTDEEGEVPLPSPDRLNHRASWIHTQTPEGDNL